MHSIETTIRAWDGKDASDLMNLLQRAWKNPTLSQADIWRIRNDKELSNKWRREITQKNLKLLEEKWPNGVVAVDMKGQILIAHSNLNEIGELYLIKELNPLINELKYPNHDSGGRLLSVLVIIFICAGCVLMFSHKIISLLYDILILCAGLGIIGLVVIVTMPPLLFLYLLGFFDGLIR